MRYRECEALGPTPCLIELREVNAEDFQALSFDLRPKLAWYGAGDDRSVDGDAVAGKTNRILFTNGDDRYKGLEV